MDMSAAPDGDIARLLGIMARLRNPEGGCPWDLEQDFASIAPYTIEEAYEVADAIDRNDLPALKDEIGDLLFVAANLARHAKVDVGGALRRANLKFERRFRAMEALAAADGTAMSALDLDAQEALWTRVKATERNPA